MTSPPPATPLTRRLGFTSAFSVVVGSVIGSGIFLTPQHIASTLRVPGTMILVWIVTGLLTLAGALTNAEISSAITDAGGQYVFFRVLFNDLIAFLYGWTAFIVYQTGSIAAVAVAFARYLGFFVPLPHLSPPLEAWHLPLIRSVAPLQDFGVKMAAIAAIMTVAVINYLGVRAGSIVQNLLTAVKVGAIGGILVGSFVFGRGSAAHFLPLWGAPAGEALLPAFGLAMVATLWSYDGWNSLTYLAGEVRDPQKTIPRALVAGTLAVIALYVLLNLAYLYILPIEQLASSTLVAADVMVRVFGPAGGAGIAAAVMISSLGTVNATSMTTARVYFAMARDGVFFRRMGRVHPRYRTPSVSLLVQALWASALTLTGTYDQIFTYVIFAAWIFYALGATGVFLLRRRRLTAVAGYRTPGYPVVPLLFVGTATGFVFNTLLQRTADSLMGAVLLLAGLPFFIFWKRHRRSNGTAAPSSIS